jgi:hypothetical protein
MGLSSRTAIEDGLDMMWDSWFSPYAGIDLL